MIIISDIHGCYYTLRRLLRKCPDEQVVFCGDLIDRGPHSKEVVDFAMRNKVPTVMGNHEDLMLCHYGLNDRYADGNWLMNGGATALDSFGLHVPSGVLAWVSRLPLFIEYLGESLLISHTGHGKAAETMDALWARSDRFPDDGLFRIFGHTPSKEPIITESYAMIDTGAAHADRGYGTMTALQWPQMRVFQQAYDETHLSVSLTKHDAVSV